MKPGGHNTGDPIAGLHDAKTDPRQEMLAFDQLGPKTRGIINERMAINWSSFETLKMLRARGLDPKRKSVDEQIAQQLLSTNVLIISKLRAEDEACMNRSV